MSKIEYDLYCLRKAQEDKQKEREGALHRTRLLEDGLDEISKSVAAILGDEATHVPRFDVPKLIERLKKAEGDLARTKASLEIVSERERKFGDSWIRLKKGLWFEPGEIAWDAETIAKYKAMCEEFAAAKREIKELRRAAKKPLCIGMRVAYQYGRREISARVVSLTPKTARIQTDTGEFDVDRSLVSEWID